jgi:hypothetical protein
MRLVTLLLLATCLTGCVSQFPCYGEDAQAAICSLQRRPIVALWDRPPSERTSARQDDALPDDAPRSPSAPGHAGVRPSVLAFRTRCTRSA